jgi:hypothetical protein
MNVWKNPYTREDGERDRRDILWMLREAAKPQGFMPNAESVGEKARSLARRGWLYESRSLIFFITDKGGAELARLEKLPGNAELINPTPKEG